MPARMGRMACQVEIDKLLANDRAPESTLAIVLALENLASRMSLTGVITIRRLPFFFGGMSMERNAKFNAR